MGGLNIHTLAYTPTHGHILAAHKHTGGTNPKRLAHKVTGQKLALVGTRTQTCTRRCNYDSDKHTEATTSTPSTHYHTNEHTATQWHAMTHNSTHTYMGTPQYTLAHTDTHWHPAAQISMLKIRHTHGHKLTKAGTYWHIPAHSAHTAIYCHKQT
jgi:hypothetical protein